MYHYPYGNAQQLNLDWILSKLQELESGSGGGADLEEVANALVSASFDAGVSYRRYDYCYYNGKLYRALNDTSGAFNPSDWLEITLGADIPVLTRLLNAVDASLTTLQGQVADLDSDDVDNASTVTGTTVTDALETLSTAVSDIDSDDVDNASNVTGTSVSDALDNLEGAVNKKILYFENVTVNQGTNAQIIRIPSSGSDPRINAKAIVVSCIIDRPEYITTELAWLTYDAGTVGINGSCTTQTTANIIIATDTE